MNMVRKLHHTHYRVNDLEASAKFYKEILGLCRGAIKTRKVCAIKTGIMRGRPMFCLMHAATGTQSVLASAEDRALRGRNPSAA